MNHSLYKFRSICSQIPDKFIRELLERWLIENVNTYQVEARIDRGSPSGVLEFEQKRTLHSLIEGLVKTAQEHETREWLQGDLKFGTIITRRIDILAPRGEGVGE